MASHDENNPAPPPRRSAGMLDKSGGAGSAQAAALAADRRIVHQREALREFMKANRLAPTIWAKKAGVPAPVLLAYLTGTSQQLDDATCEKLAQAAGVTVAALFAAKEKAAPRPPFQTRIGPGS